LERSEKPVFPAQSSVVHAPQLQGRLGSRVGAYRLLLAVLVAVISFLVISGFVMTSLIERSYQAPEKVGLF